MIAPTPERVLCHCLRITEAQIRAAVETCGHSTLRDVMRSTGAGRGCMSCHSRIRAILTGQPLPPTFAMPACSGCCHGACACGEAPELAEIATADPMPALA